MVTEVRRVTGNENQITPYHRKWGNEAQISSRIDSLKAAWADPKRKELRVAATQSDVAKEKRAASFREWREANPDKAAENLAIAQSANREANEVRLRDSLGGDPKKILSELAVRQGLSTQEIADHFDRSTTSIRELFIKYDVVPSYISSLPREEINRRQGIYYWADIFGLVQNLPRLQQGLMIRLYSNGRQKSVMEEVGREFGGITRECVRQKETKILGTLENKIASMSFPQDF